MNIITKEPEDTPGYFGSTTVTEFGDTFTHFRWGARKNDWAWRFSAGYEDVENSDDAGAGKYMTTSPGLIGPPFDYIGYYTYTARDFSRCWKFDSRAVYRPSRSTKISLGAGYSNVISGDFEMTGYYLMKNNRAELLRMFTKIEHEFDHGASGYLQWFGNVSNMNWVNAARYDAVENDVEGQYNFAVTGAHRITVGGNLRWDKINIQGDENGYYSWPGQPYDEQWAGLFAMDRWTVTERLSLEAQMRVDWYSETQTDWSNRFSALYDLDGEKNHIVRVSVAKAFRAPLASLRKVATHTVPIPGWAGFYAINVNPNEELKNEETWALEAGYTGRLSDKITVNINTFHQRLSDLIGYRTSAGMLPGTFFYTPENIDGATMYGGEAELAYEDKRKKLSVWYAYDNFDLDQPDQPIRAYRPVEHKYGLTGRLFLDDGWTLNANLKVNGMTPKNPFFESDKANLRPCTLLDLTLAKSIADGRGEIMVGVNDLCNTTREAVGETITVSGHTTPGRMFFARFQLHF